MLRGQRALEGGGKVVSGMQEETRLGEGRQGVGAVELLQKNEGSGTRRPGPALTPVILPRAKGSG